MTCIVGVEWAGGTVLGADSCTTRGNGTTTLHGDRNAKLWRTRQTVARGRHRQRQEVVAGLTGSPRVRQLLQWRLELPYRPQEMGAMEWLVTRYMDAVRETLEAGGWLKKEKERETAGAHWLVACAGQLYEAQSDLQVARVQHGYAATGSGRDVALGSLHTTGELEVGDTETAARRRVEAALRAAELHDAYVAGPMKLETQEREEGGAG